MPLVIDASVAISAIIPEAQSPIAERLLNEFEAGQWKIMVPAIFGAELTNGLRYAVRKQRHDLASIKKALIIWSKYEITHYANSLKFDWYAEKVLLLAQKHNLTIYDASYLAVALESKATLATFDKALMAAAKAFKIPLFA